MAKRVNVIKAIQVHVVTEGAAKGWAHTHGMNALGFPELEIRNVPTMFAAAATEILNRIADYMVNDAKVPIVSGASMQIGRMIFVKFSSSFANPKEGYDENHYNVPVFLVESMDLMCGSCAKPNEKLG
jgi:hypothetical protein